MSDHPVVCSTVLSTLSSSFSAYFKISYMRDVTVCDLKLGENAITKTITS